MILVSLHRAIFIFLVAISAATAVDRRCKGNHQVVDKCFTLHGRAYYSNGTPSFRIWKLGTNRVLGVTDRQWADDEEKPIAPHNLLRKFNGFETFVYGDFEVCPFIKQKPHAMQLVCVEKASHLVVETR